MVYVRHALDAAKDSISFTSGRTRSDLDSDKMLALATVRLLEIIGEAANGVSSGFRKKYPHVPWNKMVAMRNRLIHGYFDINYDIVWDTLRSDIPPLIAVLEKIAGNK